MRFNGTLPCHTRTSLPTLGIVESDREPDVSNCITVEVNHFEYFIMAIIAVLIKVPVPYVYTGATIGMKRQKSLKLKNTRGIFMMNFLN